jgi:hypothetical protein
VDQVPDVGHFWNVGSVLITLAITVASFIGHVWYRRKTEEREERRRISEEAKNGWKLDAMWEDFKERKHIKAKNGGH